MPVVDSTVDSVVDARNSGVSTNGGVDSGDSSNGTVVTVDGRNTMMTVDTGTIDSVHEVGISLSISLSLGLTLADVMPVNTVVDARNSGVSTNGGVDSGDSCHMVDSSHRVDNGDSSSHGGVDSGDSGSNTVDSSDHTVVTVGGSHTVDTGAIDSMSIDISGIGAGISPM